MEKFTFRECTMTMLDEWFSLKQSQNSESLQNWLSMSYTFTDAEKEPLLHLQKKFNKNQLHWNEYELATHFVGAIFALVDFTTDYFNDFGERYISAKIGNYELVGKPDGMVAKGFREPKIPYFCFHEYKPETSAPLYPPNIGGIKGGGDPYGQCLAAMLVGQKLNENKRPVYGCVVKGGDWNFMILENNTYTISKRFVADDEELFDIFRILQGLKTILLNDAQNQ